MEIRVVLPDAYAASDLTWFLNAAAHVSTSDDGASEVRIQAGENVRHVLSDIRNWLKLHGVTPVVVHIGDEATTFEPGPAQSY
jgi:hypothetical protein